MQQARTCFDGIANYSVEILWILFLIFILIINPLKFEKLGALINYVTINYKKINEQYDYVNEYFDKRLNSSTTSDDIEVLKEVAIHSVKQYEWSIENTKKKNK